jgi:hypothetical protein
LAEKYVADAEYAPGTVLVFGGAFEVEMSSSSHANTIAGVVSTNPAFIMNDALDSKFTVAVALTGRVPCLVTGSIRKGDRIVSSHMPGVAQALDPACYEPGCIIGKSLEDYDSTDIGTIEVAVGRL